MRTYSYDPSKAAEYGVDRMRLELGDTTLAPGELTAALCNEEYEAIIGQYKKWSTAKLKCLEAILMRFAHQVDTKHDDISYSFSDRVNFWKKLYDQLKAEIGVSSASIPSGSGKPPYFYLGMQKNTRKGGR